MVPKSRLNKSNFYCSHHYEFPDGLVRKKMGRGCAGEEVVRRTTNHLRG